MICKHILKITFINKPELFLAHGKKVLSFAIQESEFNLSHLLLIVCSM